MKKTFLIYVFFIYLISPAAAQVEYKVGEGSTMSITGTSTIHDWTSKVNEVNGTYLFKENINQKKIARSGSIVESVKMEIPVLSIESPRGATMDNKTYNALKSEEHPNIIFEITQDEIKNITDSRSDKFQLDVTGNLTIAGFTREISLTLDGQKVDEKTLKFKGSFPVDMVTYKVEPPTAMFGQIKTGKDVSIDFELTLVR
ncbi:MAG: YceI family protein [Cyclobacteriaceae bacterium]|nr:YceI family protein [Cyclobacteriaceae bacterium]